MLFSTVAQQFSQLLSSTVILFSTAILLPAIAAAPIPPKLVMAKLNGQPVYVLSVTSSSDKVVVRCYPGEQPSIAVISKVNGTTEGILTCGT